MRCIICTSPHVFGRSHRPKAVGGVPHIYYTGVGLSGVARFDKLGNARASTRGTSDKRLHVFRMYQSNPYQLFLFGSHKNLNSQAHEKVCTCTRTEFLISHSSSIKQLHHANKQEKRNHLYIRAIWCCGLPYV